MRLISSVLVALLSGNNVANAFVPPIASRHDCHALNLSSRNEANENNQHATVSFEGAKNALLGTFTAATLLMGTLAPLPDETLSVANAAVATVPVATVPATKSSPAAPADPLAAEKKAVESAKAAYAAAQKPVSDAKSNVAGASSFFAKDKSAREIAQKKATDLKKSLLDVNDKLAQAKSKSGSSPKLIEVLSKSVGESFDRKRNLSTRRRPLSIECHVVCFEYDRSVL